MHKVTFGKAAPTKSGTMSQKSEEAPQRPEDARREPDYNNIHKMDWVRGANEDACAMPHFDHSPPRSKMRR
jgi:hypothetical protein